MSSTNKTANLQLSQFVGSDIPSILTDYNGDMRKIDTGVEEVRQATAGAVSDLSSVTGRVTNVESDISSLNSTVNGLGTRVTANEGAITTLSGNVSEIQNIIPEDATSENKLATADEVSDLADTVREISQTLVHNVIHKDMSSSYFTSVTTFEEYFLAIINDIRNNANYVDDVKTAKTIKIGGGGALFGSGTAFELKVVGDPFSTLSLCGNAYGISFGIINVEFGGDTGGGGTVLNHISRVDNCHTYNLKTSAYAEIADSTMSGLKSAYYEFEV